MRRTRQDKGRTAWQTLSMTQQNMVWNRFATQFAFRPSVDAAQFPGIREPTPSVTYSIAAHYDGDATATQQRELDLAAKTLTALQRIVPVGQPVYALDWQHPCYWFTPTPRLMPPISMPGVCL